MGFASFMNRKVRQLWQSVVCATIRSVATACRQGIRALYAQLCRMVRPSIRLTPGECFKHCNCNVQLRYTSSGKVVMHCWDHGEDFGNRIPFCK